MPPSAPSLRELWLPVTVRVAWALARAGVRYRPEVVAEAREHVLRCLPPGVGVDEAEALAGPLTRDWLDRVQHGRYRRVEAPGDLVAARGWRDALLDGLDRTARGFLRLHLAMGHPVEEIERRLGIDRSELEAARRRLRRRLRAVAPDLADEPDEHIDALLARVATLAEPGCPGPVGLVSPQADAHAERCPRCGCARVLLRGGRLRPEDLFVPADPLPAGEIEVAALLLHPDARRHEPRVARVLGPEAVRVEAGAWLLPAGRLRAVAERLRGLCLQGTPARYHLRGVVLRGPGRRSRSAFLGPLPVTALERARGRVWGEVDAVGELPPPLPPPPRSTPWWGATLGLALLTLTVAVHASAPRPVPGTVPLEARFRPLAGGGGWDLRFDTDDLAAVDVVVVAEDGTARHVGPVVAGKGAWATGDGDYALRVAGALAAVVASPEGIEDLDELVGQALAAPDPAARLAELVHEHEPRASVAVAPPGRAPAL